MEQIAVVFEVKYLPDSDYSEYAQFTDGGCGTEGSVPAQR